MKLSTLNKVTRWTICLGAVALACFAWHYNRAHLITASGLFILGLKAEWVRVED